MPHRCLYASLALILFCSFFLAPVTIHGTTTNHLLISEMLYDPAAPEPGAEWVELFNPTADPVSLAGWSLKDNTSTDPLPAYIIAPGQYLIVASNQADFLAANPGFTGALVSLDGPIGNGLSNSGDVVLLLDGGGGTVDAISYGSDASAFNPPCPDVNEGQSLSRQPSDVDSDSASDWMRGTPTPGSPSTPPTATNTPLPTGTSTSTFTPTLTPGNQPTPTSTNTGGPTPTPSATASATATHTGAPETGGQLLLTEIFYDPPQSGTDSSYEFVEIYNPTTDSILLDGWRLRDNGAEDQLPAATISARSYLVIAATQDGFLANFPAFSGQLVALESPIGNGLNNAGDAVLLIGPDGAIVDAMSYGSDTSVFDPPCPDVAAGYSLARSPSDQDTNTSGDWRPQGTPNPGEAGAIPTVTPSVTLTPTKVASSTPTPSPTVITSPTPTRTPTVRATRTPTPTATRTRLHTATATHTVTPTPTATMALPVVWPKLLISEVLYDAVQGGTDSDFEWVEVRNPTTITVTLAGWRIQDNAGQDVLPTFELTSGEYAVVAAKAAIFAAENPTFSGKLVGLEGAIGNGLSNTGDAVQLVAPDGRVIDAMSYGTNKTVFDPPCADAGPGQSLARIDGVADSDTAKDWEVQEAPNPGAPAIAAAPTPTQTSTVTSTAQTPTQTATPTSAATATALPPEAFRVTLNEILPDPATVDWDRDGEASFMDEWIELTSDAGSPVSLDGWSVSDDTNAYTIPPGTVIWSHSFLLLYRTQTRLSLGDWHDTVTLTRSDGSLADRFIYERGPGDDRSYCHGTDGTGAWTGDCEVTPGGANRLLPPPPSTSSGAPGSTPSTAFPQTVSAARGSPEDTRTTITGAVTLPPGLIAKTIYIQDATGGIKIYLRSGEYGQLSLGDQVRVTGWTRNFYGEAELSVPDPSYLTRLGPGKPLAALPVTSTGLNEANEGRLVQVVGAVIKFEPRALVLQDRGGTMRIYFPQSLPWRRPYVNIGEMWAAQGILGQYVGEKTTDAGYQIIPRFKSDVVNGPAFLPVTGGCSDP